MRVKYMYKYLYKYICAHAVQRLFTIKVIYLHVKKINIVLAGVAQ